MTVCCGCTCFIKLSDFLQSETGGIMKNLRTSCSHTKVKSKAE